MKKTQEIIAHQSGEMNHAGHSRVTLKAIPSHFLEWLASSRIKFLNDMIEGRPMRYFSAHLPVMATWGQDDPFPVNMTVKGIGLIPRDEYIQDYTDMFEATIAEARTSSWSDSLHARIEIMNKLYQDVNNFDPSLLGGLEIFEGKAYENLRGNRLTSLLYVGMNNSDQGMQYISFQVNGNVELLGKDNLYYRYLLASRKLFEFEKFHLYQPDYPFGYLINVSEVRDKAPWSRGKYNGSHRK